MNTQKLNRIRVLLAMLMITAVALCRGCSQRVYASVVEEQTAAGEKQLMVAEGQIDTILYTEAEAPGEIDAGVSDNALVLNLVVGQKQEVAALKNAELNLSPEDQKLIVIKEGVITARQAGQISASFSSDNKSYGLNISIYEPGFKRKSYTVNVGGQVDTEFDAGGFFASFEILPKYAELASVDSAGVVTGVKRGTLRMNAIINGVRFPVQITVDDPSVSTTRLSLSVGQKQKIKLQGCKGKAVWNSSDPAVATVKNGRVTGVSRGEAVITAQINGQVFRSLVFVSRPQTTHKILELDIGDGKRVGIVGIGDPEYADIWMLKGRDKGIIALSADGSIKALAKGKAVIYTKVGKKKYQIKVKVSKNQGAAHDHYYREVTRDVTEDCAAHIEVLYRCDCGSAFVTRDEAGHDFTVISHTPATCISPALKEVLCARCGYSEARDVSLEEEPLKEHELVKKSGTENLWQCRICHGLFILNSDGSYTQIKDGESKPGSSSSDKGNASSSNKDNSSSSDKSSSSSSQKDPGSSSSSEHIHKYILTTIIDDQGSGSEIGYVCGGCGQPRDDAEGEGTICLNTNYPEDSDMINQNVRQKIMNGHVRALSRKKCGWIPPDKMEMAGWMEEPGENAVRYKPGELISVSANQVLYARWEKTDKGFDTNDCTVVYDGKRHSIDFTLYDEALEVFFKDGNESDAQWTRALPEYETAGVYKTEWMITGKNFAKTQGSTTLTIEKAPGQIGFAGSRDLVYCGTAIELIQRVTSNTGTVVYSSSRDGEYHEGIPVGINAGIYNVWYYSRGDENHLDTEPEWTEAEIRKAETAMLKEPVKKENLVYNGSDQPLITAPEYDCGEILYSVRNDLYEEPEYTDELPCARDAGTYYICVKSSGDDNHEESEVTTKKVTISKAPDHIITQARGRNLNYNAAMQELVFPAYSDSGNVKYAVGVTENKADFSYELPQAADAGEYTISYYAEGDRNHYPSEIYTAKTVIAPAVLQISFEDTEALYDGYSHYPTVVVDSSMMIPEGENAVIYFAPTAQSSWLYAADGEYLNPSYGKRFPLTWMPKKKPYSVMGSYYWNERGSYTMYYKIQVEKGLPGSAVDTNFKVIYTSCKITIK